MKQTVIAILLSTFAVVAFRSEAALAPQESSLSKIKDDLAEKASQAEKIAASIKSLEKEIGKVNNKYLERSRSNRSLEEKLEKLRESLAVRLAELKKKESKAKKLMNLYALEGTDGQDDGALLKKAVLEELLRKKLDELSRLKRGAAKLGETFSDYSSRLKTAREDEESMYALILDLENKKKDLSKTYISSLENKNELEAKLEGALAKRKAYASAGGVQRAEIRLVPPLEKFIRFKGSRKGVTFKYDSRAPVKASAGGKVVYSGELASYGKVIMVDHGREVRSVILGDVEIKVKKGDTVEQGQILGYTLAEPGLQKSLYYEVRKKNVAQNTLRWLESGKKLANI